MLLGVPARKLSYKRRNTAFDYEDQGISLRMLLFASLKHYGGLEATDASLSDQQILFVDVSRDSAADILKIHKKLALINASLKPGRLRSPRYVIVCGDQPTYRMLVKIWIQSYKENYDKNRVRVSAQPEQIRIHEWLVALSGLFHVEKQSLFSLCKEMLHGMGLKELASCSGLSDSQIDNILKHAHARNNRGLLFSICAAMLIHTSDLLLSESPGVPDSIKNIYRCQNSPDRNLG